MQDGFYACWFVAVYASCEENIVGFFAGIGQRDAVYGILADCIYDM